MSTKILFNGCSYCFGDELKDNEKSRYSRLICDELGAEEINISKNGNSNYKIITDTYNYLQNNDVDIVSIGITYLERFCIPYKDILITINPSNTRAFKPVYDILAKLVYSSTNHETWFLYYSPLYDMLETYCKSKNIKTVYHCVKEKDLRLFTEKTDLNLFEIPFNKFAKSNYPMGKHYHPLEEAHEAYASLLVDKFRNV